MFSYTASVVSVGSTFVPGEVRVACSGIRDGDDACLGRSDDDDACVLA